MTIVVDRRQQVDISEGNGREVTLVRVHWLEGMDQCSRSGAAMRAGIRCGDVLIGLDGVAFAESLAPHEESSLAQHAFTRLRTGPDPAVLHIQRPMVSSLDRNHQSPARQGSIQSTSASFATPINTPSLLDTTDITTESSSPLAEFTVHSDISSPAPELDHGQIEIAEQPVHPFIQSLDAKGLVQNSAQLKTESRAVNETVAYILHRSHNGLAPTKALSVRIVNMFDDQSNHQTAYTLWVYDVHLGKEWYAPFRYWSDFQDLRTAMMAIVPAFVRPIPFPSPPHVLSFLRSPSSSKENATQKEKRALLLEQFLRSLNTLVYSLKDHSMGAEIGMHLQSFLGGDERILEAPATLPTIIQVTTSPSKSTIGNSSSTRREDQQHELALKQSIQYLTFRLFHLDSLRQVVDTFVDSFRASAPHLRDIEHMEAKGHACIKASAIEDLDKIHHFLDKLQDIIVEGCRGDFQRMAKCYYHVTGNAGDSVIPHDEWDRLVREAVREQVEIEIYVPLRSCVSGLLVHGWRYEDMEIQFKIQELRKKPPSFFRIPHDMQYDWSAASTILSKGVGLSTLPTVKLRAIVAAAREIFRVSAEGNNCRQQTLGADDFLPIFIFCVVHADLERPCALTVLLRALCDRNNKTGEIGYYLLSFEAAIAHCHEVDLTENCDNMDSSLGQLPCIDSGFTD